MLDRLQTRQATAQMWSLGKLEMLLGGLASESGFRPLCFWIALLFADAVATQIGVSVGGIEANPLLSFLASVVGLKGMLLLKSLVGIGAGVMLLRTQQTRVLATLSYGLLGVVAFDMAVITFNSIWIPNV